MRIFLPSILTSPLMPLVLSLLALLSSPPLFVRLPLLCFFLRCLPSSCLLLSPSSSSPSGSFLRSVCCLCRFFSPFSVVSAGWGGCLRLGSTQVVAPAPPGFPPLSAPSALLSVPPPAVPPPCAPPSRPPGVSVLSPSASSLLSLAPFAWPVSSAHALGSFPVVWGFHGCLRVLTLLCCTLSPVSDPPVLSADSALPPFCSAPLRVPGLASSSTGSTFGPDGSAPQPGPSSAFPPLSGASATPSAPPLSEFDYGPVDPFAPGFVDPAAPDAAAPDPEAPVPPPLSASARAEVRRMYQCLVDLLPQAPRPPRALFVEFFDAPSSPLHPVFLSWLSVPAPHSRSLPLALFLCWLVVVRGPPFCLLVRLSILLVAVLGFCGSGYSFVAGYVWASALTVSGFPAGGLVTHCACCPCVLRAVRGFQVRGVLATCLLLTGAPGFGSFSFSSAHLSLCSSLLQPSLLWGLFLVGSGVCLWCHRHSCCASLSFLMGAC